MRLDDLIAACRTAAENRRGLGMDPAGAHVLLSIPGTWGKRETAPLLGRRGGPRGRIIHDVGRAGYLLVDFDAAEVSAFLEARLARPNAPLPAATS